MQLHPSVLLFAVLAMATAFGLVGALIATPIPGIVAGFVEAFYLSRQAERNLDQDVQRLLHG
jgi:putative permease